MTEALSVCPVLLTSTGGSGTAVPLIAIIGLLKSVSEIVQLPSHHGSRV